MRKAQNMGVETIGEQAHDHRRHYQGLNEAKRVPQTHLSPSEIVTIGILFALKGGHFRAFYRWLNPDFAPLFAGLPDRTNLQRLLKTRQQH